MDDGIVIIEPEGLPKDSFIGPEFSTFSRSKVDGKVKKKSSNNRHLASQTQTADTSVLNRVIKCTVCCEQILVHITNSVAEHPILHVILCKRCHTYYHSGSFTKDEQGIDEFCRWCAEGGELIICDSCPNVFCKICIRRNFSRKEANQIMNSDEVECFVCNNEPIRGLVEECQEVLAAIEVQYPSNNKKKRKTQNSTQNHEEGNTSSVSSVKVKQEATKTRASSIPSSSTGDGRIIDFQKSKSSVNTWRENCIELVEDVSIKTSDLHSSFNDLFIPENDNPPPSQIAAVQLRAINKVKPMLKNVISMFNQMYSSLCKTEKKLKPNVLSEDCITTGKESESELDSENTILSPSRKRKRQTKKFRDNILRLSDSPAAKTWRKLNDEDKQADPKKQNPSVQHSETNNSGNPAGGVSVSDIFNELTDSENDDLHLFKPRKKKSALSSRKNSIEKPTQPIKEEFIPQNENAPSTYSESGSPIKKKRAKKGSSESETTDSDKTPSKRSEKKEKKADGSKVSTKKKPNDVGSSDSSETEIESTQEIFSDDQLATDVDFGKPSKDLHKEENENDAAIATIQKIVEEEDCSGSPSDEDVREVLEREARKEKSDKDKTADKREDEEKGDVKDKKEKGDLRESEEKDGKEGSGSESEENGNSKSIIKNALLREPISPIKESGKSSKSVKRKTNDENTGAPTKRVRRSLNLEEALGDENLLEEDKLVLQNKDERDEDDISDASGLLKSSDEELKEPASPNSACTSVVGSDDTHVSSLHKDGPAGSDAQSDGDIVSDAKTKTKGKSDAESETKENSDAESETNENSDAKSEKKEKSDAKSESKKADNKKSDGEKTAKSSGNTGSKKSNVECITIDSDSDVGNPQNGSSSDSEGVSFKVKKRGKGQTWLDDFFKSEPVSNDSEEEKEGKVKKEDKSRPHNKKKRRRIRDLGSDNSKEDSTGEDAFHDDQDSAKKSRRRNIRKILDLSKSTQDAERMEKARRKRLEQDENAPKEEVIIIPDDQSPQKKKKVITHLVLSKKPLIEVDRTIVRALKPHQVEGIKFLWRNVVENVNRANRGKGDGCILAHCMGLGKTLQVIAFLHTVLHSPHLPKLHTALVVCPLGTVLNWCKEIDMWTRKSDQPIAIYNLSETKSFHERATMLKKWHKKGGVMMTGYKMFLLMSSSKKGKYKRYNHLFAEHMLQPGPDIVVCDEGHIIKNEATSLCTVMSSIKTRRRVVLTGTPLQNNLMEYYCMVNFIKPRLLGSAKEFNNRFTHPISNGQHVDSTEKDVKLMKKRSHVLHELLAGCVQRKDIDCLREQLMPKYEYVLRVRLTPLQIALYERYLSTFKCSDISNRKGCLFQDFKNLLLVVCHPKVLVLDKLRREQQRLAETAREDIRSFLNDEDEDDESSEIGSEEEIDPPSPDELLRLPTMSVQELKKLIISKGGSVQHIREKEDLISCAKLLLTKSTDNGPDELWYEKVMPSDSNLIDSVEMSGKVTLLLRILKHSAQVGDKVVVFSQSLLTLDLIEDVLRNITMKENDTSRAESGIRINKWYKDIDYCRIDGSVKQNSRKNCIDQFNTHVDVRCRLMLVSTRAGGIGINLIGANRAIVFDASWNPTHDVQSIFRIYRFGQSKPCFVYRFIAQGTMEEKIYDRQVVKQSLAFRVVDEQQIERHYTANDIAELYTFKPERLTDDVLKTRPTPVLPKDTLLADILKARSTRDLIVSYHEHDSLLGHQAGEELSEADRRSAWDEYDRERFPPVPVDSPLLKLSVSVLDQLITLADAELVKNTKQMDNCKSESLDETMLRVKYLNQSMSIHDVEKTAVEIQTRRMVFLPQLERTRSFILQKKEQLVHCKTRLATKPVYTPRIPPYTGNVAATAAAAAATQFTRFYQPNPRPTGPTFQPNPRPAGPSYRGGSFGPRHQPFRPNGRPQAFFHRPHVVRPNFPGHRM